MHRMMSLIAAAGIATALFSQTRISFPSEDGLACTADLYLAKEDRTTPFIVLFHQATYSRGEYRDIAPRLNQLGFNCMAVDARSGSRVKGVQNETALAARAAGKPAAKYLDALPDLRAALRYAREHHAGGKLIAWGSSYSSSLCLFIAGAHPDLVDGVLAFSPGEFFTPEKPRTWIAEAAARISNIPVFITSGPSEGGQWEAIFEAIPSPGKRSYLPKEVAGLHGSSVLWSDLGNAEFSIPNPLAPGYWTAVETFLSQHFAR